MRNRILTVLVAGAMVALGATACATAGGGGGETHHVTFQIDNNLPGISGLSTYVLTQTGGRRSLGPVESNQRRTFQKDLETGSYQLLASNVGSPDIVSERFRIDTDSLIVIWNVAVNQLTFGTR